MIWMKPAHDGPRLQPLRRCYVQSLSCASRGIPVGGRHTSAKRPAAPCHSLVGSAAARLRVGLRPSVETLRAFTRQRRRNTCAFNCSAWRADCVVTRIYQPSPACVVPPHTSNIATPPWRTTKASTRTGCLCTPSPSRCVSHFSRS
jgi:hypothetical protein